MPAGSGRLPFGGMAVVLVLWLLRSAVRADLASDKAECANQLVGLATCLPFVQGNARVPTPDCCGPLKQVLANSPKCLCLLIKDGNDPQLALNLTLALSLPSLCAAPANISDCPRLLNLPPDSKDAQIFKQFGSSAQGSVPSGSVKGNSSANGSGSVGVHENSVRRRNYLRGREWLGVEMVGWFLLLVLPLMVLAA